MVIRNMTRQLALPIDIVGGETVRPQTAGPVVAQRLPPRRTSAEALSIDRELNAIRDAVRQAKAISPAWNEPERQPRRPRQWKTDYVAVR